MSIDSFQGEYRWLSNFHEATVEFEGQIYPTNEHAFQAAKTLDPQERTMIKLLLTAREAKHMGRKVQLRPNWEQIKNTVMYEINYSKYTRHPELKAKLLATGEQILTEGNTWNDTYWGVCNHRGENWLGRILMRIRSELAEEARK